MPDKFRGSDSFRPALRFPTDPTKPTELPTRTAQITHVQPPPRSVRRSWELDVDNLPDCSVPPKRSKVIVVLGDPPSSSINPIVYSPYLRGSLLIIVTSADANLGITPSSIIPDVRILRLKHTSPSNHEILSAARLVSVLEWAHNVAAEWRADGDPLTFSITLEDAIDQITASPAKQHQRFSKQKSKSKSFSGHDAEDFPDPRMHAHQPFWRAMPHDSGASSASDSSLSRAKGAEMYKLGKRGSRSVQSHADGLAGSSSSAPGSASRHRRLRSSLSTSAFTNVSANQSVEAVNGRPKTPKSRTGSALSAINIISGRDKPNQPPEDSNQRSFDVIINFLHPNPALAGASYGVGFGYGPGTISSLNAQATHNKALLRQTILVTTACQRFLAPITPTSSRSKLLGSAPGSYAHSSSGHDEYDNQYQRKRTQSTSKRISSAFRAMFDPKSALPTPPTSASSSSGSGSGASSPPEMWHGLPGTGSGSMHGHGSGTSALGHDRLSSWPKRNLPKIVHVLPFNHSVPTHLVNSPMHLANARLIRSLEAFLLSWSYGGKSKEGEKVAGKVNESLTSDHGHGSGAASSYYAPTSIDTPSGSSSSLSSLTSFSTNIPGINAKNSTPGIVRPFLLDLAGLSDVFKSTPAGDEPQKWTVAELIISGALDNEYPLSQPDIGFGQSEPVPVVGQRQSAPAALAPASSNVIGKDYSWASRRAWLGGVGELSLVPSPSTDGGSSPVNTFPGVAGPSSSSSSFTSSSTSRSRPSSGQNGSSSAFSAPPSSWTTSPSNSQAQAKRPSLNVATKGASKSSGYQGPTLSPIESQSSPRTTRQGSTSVSPASNEIRLINSQSGHYYYTLDEPQAAPMLPPRSYVAEPLPTVSYISSSTQRTTSQASSRTSYEDSSSYESRPPLHRSRSSNTSASNINFPSSNASEAPRKPRKSEGDAWTAATQVDTTPSRSSTIRAPSSSSRPSPTPLSGHSRGERSYSSSRIVPPPEEPSRSQPSTPEQPASRHRSSKGHNPTKRPSKSLGGHDELMSNYVSIVSPPTPSPTRENFGEQIYSSSRVSPIPAPVVYTKPPVTAAPAIQISSPSPLRKSSVVVPVNKEKGLPPPPPQSRSASNTSIPTTVNPRDPQPRVVSADSTRAVFRHPIPQEQSVYATTMDLARQAMRDPRTPAKQREDDLLLAKETAAKEKKNWWRRSASKAFKIL